MESINNSLNKYNPDIPYAELQRDPSEQVNIKQVSYISSSTKENTLYRIFQSRQARRATSNT
ncbi:MAG: hypothetical protein SP1CHLAM9_02420 [Chlamydiia bacterium]|nr:hypothetical protein [Chlamydiia bacterium]MCH9624452.1 hypothetical protein [Chlamydiia bacterium]